MKQPHICLGETLGVRYAVLPGDPARLDRVAAQLEAQKAQLEEEVMIGMGNDS